MSNGTNQRARVDNETPRALLLANGAGAIAMLAVLPPILDRAGYEPMALAMLIGVLVLVIGVAFAIVHGYLRRRCALVHEQHQMNPPKGSLLGIQLRVPAVCFLSAAFMWLSIATFVGAGGFVAATGIMTINELQTQKLPPRPAAGELKAKARR
jgi:hypothetical protein